MTKHYTPTTEVPDFEDFRPYPATLQAIEHIQAREEYGGGPRLQLTWRLQNGTTLLDFVSFKLGFQQGGSPSKMRSLLNAVANRPKHGAVEWIDDDSLEFKFPESESTWMLREGETQVIIRGQNAVSYSPTGEEIKRFRINLYERADETVPF